MRLPFAFQGIECSYSDQAIESFCSDKGIDYEVMPQHTFRNLFDTVASGKALGAVPIENSTTGSIVKCYDLFMEYEDIEIIAELYLRIKHCLVSRKGNDIKDLKKLISHPEALSQCSGFMESYGFEHESVSDTAESARIVSESSDSTIAGISSRKAAERFNLDILKEDFQDNDNNVTRFLIVKKKGSFDEVRDFLGEPSKTTLLFETRHIPAALYKALGGFATNSINLSKIESRPKKGHRRLNPIFFLDCESSLDSREMKHALEELNFYSQDTRILGTYEPGNEK